MHAHRALFRDREPISEYFERTNTTYVPRHIHPEYCRYTTEQECRERDETERRKLQLRLRNPRTGTIKALVLLVMFPDHQNRYQNLPPVSYYQELCDGIGTSTTNPAGSIASYFSEQSYQNYNIECDIAYNIVPHGRKSHLLTAPSSRPPSHVRSRHLQLSWSRTAGWPTIGFATRCINIDTYPLIRYFL